MDDTRLRFDRLRRGFGALRVLSEVSGEVGAGEALMVTGANGSGKSTLLRCLAGLLAPESGEISYREAGTDLPRNERRRRLGYVAPDLTLYPELTTRENVVFGARLRGHVPERGLEILQLLGLPLDRMTSALSAGMHQRLRWAWALLHHPRLLLLDEPLQNLDSPGIAGVTELLRTHLESGGLAVIANPSSLDLPGVSSRIELVV